MITAVVAQTKTAAEELASELGVDMRWVFGARCAPLFEGLRANLVLVDSTAEIPADFMATIHATVLKTPGGQVRFIGPNVLAT